MPSVVRAALLSMVTVTPLGGTVSMAIDADLQALVFPAASRYCTETERLAPSPPLPRLQSLVSGEVDIAVQSKPELSSTEGVEVVGPLPGDLGSTNVFAAGVGASSSNSETGKALVKFLTSPEAQAAFTAHGFDRP